TRSIDAVASNGSFSISGDSGPSTSAACRNRTRGGWNCSGNTSNPDNRRIRKVVAATGNIQTVAGTGTYGFNGDGGLATNAELTQPTGVYVDSSGNIFIADSGNQRIREVDAATGNIQTVAGNGTFGFSGDGGPATNAELAQ